MPAHDPAPRLRARPVPAFCSATVLLGALACSPDEGEGQDGSESDTEGSASTGGSSGSDPTGSGGGVGPASGGAAQLPATCEEAAADYTIDTQDVTGSSVASSEGRWTDSRSAEVPVAVATDGTVYVGFTSESGDGASAVVATANATVATIEGARMAGVAATADGIGMLYFDPNPDTGERTWATVSRFSVEGQEVFSTDLFRSPNLEDVGTKGGPTTSRLGYLPAQDELVAYFGHTQRYDDGVRHQGGYLATVDSSGSQDLLDGWFGSHNLDQRLLTNDGTGAVLGLGDAYPEGIFFSFLDDPDTTVIHPLAAAGNGAVNGQLGGMVDLGTTIAIPFITNTSLPQDLDAGTWPDIDDAVADRIRDAASNGTDIGLLLVPNTGQNPNGELDAVWVDAGLAPGASFTNLKSARYGTGNMILLMWTEESDPQTACYTMIVDPTGATCQPKLAIDCELTPAAGDDMVLSPTGQLIWGTEVSGAARLVTLSPG